MKSQRAHRTLWRQLGIGLAVALIGCCVLAQSASAKGKQPPKPLYWGAMIGKQLTGKAPPWDMNAVTEFEAMTGKGLSLLGFSAPFADCYVHPCTSFPFPTAAMETLRERGTIPYFTWASQNIHQSSFRLASISSGAYDEYVRDFAEQVQAWGHPFFLRFDQEMNGFWFPWSEGISGNRPGSFVKAWRHIHDIFSEVGATNATWVWCPNVDFTHKLTPLHSLYPGGRYVDWTCLDGFNWGDTANSAGWMSFEGIFRSTYERVVKIAPHKPMMIGETASEERGGSKASWIRKTLKILPKRFPKVRGLVWFNEKDRAMRWPIESSTASRNAFAKAIQRTVYRPNEFSELGPGPIPPPSWP
jgi:hypothetical protein